MGGRLTPPRKFSGGDFWRESAESRAKNAQIASHRVATMPAVCIISLLAPLSRTHNFWSSRPRPLQMEFPSNGFLENGFHKPFHVLYYSSKKVHEYGFRFLFLVFGIPWPDHHSQIFCKENSSPLGGRATTFSCPLDCRHRYNPRLAEARLILQSAWCARCHTMNE